MKKRHRERIEARLLEERERAMKALGIFDDRQHERDSRPDDGDLSLYRLHPADEGTDTMAEEKDLLMASKEGQILYAIDEALRKLYKRPEDFGRCEACGERIDIERLEIVPWAANCVSCQQAQEEGTVD